MSLEKYIGCESGDCRGIKHPFGFYRQKITVYKYERKLPLWLGYLFPITVLGQCGHLGGDLSCALAPGRPCRFLNTLIQIEE